MCINVSLPNECNICNDLIKEIVEKLEIDETSQNYAVLLEVFKFIEDSIKKLPEDKRKRKNGEPYIVHFVETTKIFLNISENPILNQVIMALLHDMIEDVDDITFELLIKKIGFDIACGVRNLSKISIAKNISGEERKVLKEEIVNCTHKSGINKKRSLML